MQAHPDAVQISSAEATGSSQICFSGFRGGVTAGGLGKTPGLRHRLLFGLDRSGRGSGLIQIELAGHLFYACPPGSCRWEPLRPSLSSCPLTKASGKRGGRCWRQEACFVFPQFLTGSLRTLGLRCESPTPSELLCRLPVSASSCTASPQAVPPLSSRKDSWNMPSLETSF